VKAVAQRLELFFPRIPKLGKPMQQNHQVIARATLGVVQANAVYLSVSMLDGQSVLLFVSFSVFISCKLVESFWFPVKRKSTNQTRTENQNHNEKILR
jgi:hypothetical protein